jgi:hypothetical protein
VAFLDRLWKAISEVQFWRRPGGRPQACTLFFAVLFGVSHHRVFGVLSSVNHVAPCGVSMVCRLFMMSSVVMFGGFAVVASGMRQMF